MMRSRDEHNNPMESSAYRELQVLSEVVRSPEITQRQLAQRVGIALGLTNVVLRNLAQKGYVRITNAGWRRWLYAVTPEGFSHKLRLTVAYVRRVLDDYVKVRQTLREQLAPLALHEESRVAILGTEEFAELVYLGLRDIGIEEIEVFGQNNTTDEKFLGMPVQDVGTMQADRYDRVVIALLNDSEPVLMDLKGRGIPLEKLVTFFPDGRVENGVKEAG